MAFLLGAATDWSARQARPDQPAGFWWGFLHGALMPTALHSLAAGRDVTIYAAHNTGVSYKLGYTMGVNGCGLLFFGMLFWRPKEKAGGVQGSKFKVQSPPERSDAHQP